MNEQQILRYTSELFNMLKEAVEKEGKPFHNVDIKLVWMDVDDDENVVELTAVGECYVNVEKETFLEDCFVRRRLGRCGDGRF